MNSNKNLNTEFWHVQTLTYKIDLKTEWDVCSLGHTHNCIYLHVSLFSKLNSTTCSLYVTGLKMAAKSKIETRGHKTKQQHNLLAVTVPVYVQVKVKIALQQATRVQSSTLSSTLALYRGRYRGELSYLAPLGSENIFAPYFKQCFFQGGGVLPPRQSNTTPASPQTEITNILFYILNFASIIKFKM